MYPFHYASEAHIAAPVASVFDFVDDHSKLSSHMSKSSGMMGGGSMQIATDDKHFRAVGSSLTLSGRVLGILLSVTEAVVARTPPTLKVWRTTGTPKLLVVGDYQMGFKIEPNGVGSTLRVFIDYALPTRGIGRLLGRLFGRAYAKWCTERMAHDAQAYFLNSDHVAAKA